VNLYEYLIDAFNQAPVLIQIGFLIVLALIICIITLIISLRAIRSYLNIKGKEIIKNKKEFEALVVEYLYSGTGFDELSEKQLAIITRIKDAIISTSKRKSVITILSNLMNEVSGEMSDSIKTLYHKIGLITYATQRLESKKWHIVAKAIVELRRFKVYETQDKVATFLNHPRKEIRKEAQLYSVHLFKFNGLSFLDDLETPLSEWHQLLLLEALLNLENQKICDITPWLKSSNTSVVLFALKLVKIYTQFERKETLIELLSHPEKEVRVYTLKVLKELFGYEAEESLIENTSTSDLRIDAEMSLLNLVKN